MKVQVPLGEEQNRVALCEYVIRQGFAKAFAVELTCSPGNRIGDPATFSAIVHAETKDPKAPHR